MSSLPLCGASWSRSIPREHTCGSTLNLMNVACLTTALGRVYARSDVRVSCIAKLPTAAVTNSAASFF